MTSTDRKRINVERKGIILEKTDFVFENEGVFNPACIQDDEGRFHMFYRAVSEGNYSSVGYCLLSDPLTVAERWNKPIYKAQHYTEEHGVEDPRIVKIDDTYYLTYTAYDGLNALGALATSKDLKTFERKGVITPNLSLKKFRKMLENNHTVAPHYLRHVLMLHERPNLEKGMVVWDKDVIYFPRKINGKFAYLHRIYPSMQIVYHDTFEELQQESFWVDYFNNFDDYIVLEPKLDFETSHIGGGSPPIETPEGWILINHGVEKNPNGRIYHGTAVLTDLDDPTKIISRLPYPLLSPDTDFELTGYVNNVVFPTGQYILGDDVYMYYGAADARIGVAKFSLQELLDELLYYAK